MSAVTTHVLDVSKGRPAGGVTVALWVRNGDAWRELGRGTTNADGRCGSLLAPASSLAAGTYRLTFDTGAYFASTGVEGFYPEVSVVFEVREADAHHHVPLLLSPFGYSTYRGS